MTGAYLDKNYVYAVARIRGAELKLLNSQALNELAGAQMPGDVLDILKEKGWGREEDMTAEELLKSEREKLWELIDELVPDLSVFDVFKKPNDYHNLKAAIKESMMDFDYPGIYIDEATIDPEVIKNAIKERNYGELPTEMVEPARLIHDTFLRTGDGQLCDVMTDRICLEELIRSGENSGDDFLKEYSILTAAAANIKVALRCARTGKDREFLEAAVAECPTLDRNALINAALQGEDQLASYLTTTDYVDAVPELKKDATAFENYCDNLIIRRMRNQLTESFGLGPIAAYILAKESEIKSVRIIFSGKENGFSEEMIMERMRETYV
ncbi:MAG: V-type ATPase subunit [Eubacteriales bacterium]|nr:V-type ATPase subunit [Eubacteriales bacterium]